jgi:DNA polymerase III delta prime subunit
MTDFQNDEIPLVPQQCEIVFEKNFLNNQPDFNDFDAVLTCVSNMNSITQLEYSDFNYKISSKDSIQVAKDIYFELKEINKLDKTDKISRIKFRIYTDDLKLKDLKEYVQKCREEYEAQKNNKLGNEVFFFDQITTRDSKFQNYLSFDKKRFMTSRTFDNVFFEERLDVANRVNHFMNNKQWYDKRGIPHTIGFLFHGPPGTGKCLAPDTPVMVWGGQSKLARDITLSDTLVDDECRPVAITGIATGQDYMYRVSYPHHSGSYTVNSAHILSVTLTNTFTTLRQTNGEYILIWYKWGSANNRDYSNLIQHREYLCNFTQVKARRDEIMLTYSPLVAITGDTLDINVVKYMQQARSFKQVWQGYKPQYTAGWLNTLDFAQVTNTLLTQGNLDTVSRRIIMPAKYETWAASMGFNIKYLPNQKKISIAGLQVWRFLPSIWIGKVDTQWMENSYPITVSRVGWGPYVGFTLPIEHPTSRFLLSDYTVTHNTSTIKAIANITHRHIINVRLSEIKTNTQLKNLFFNPVLQVENPETLTVEKFTVPIHQRFYVIEDIDCMGDLIKKREFKNQEVIVANQNNKKEVSKPTVVKKPTETPSVKSLYTEDDDADLYELENYYQTALVQEKKDMDDEQREEEERDKITLDSLLNILDGTLEIPNRMFCVTTNHIEVIDPALIRPGRVDMIIEFKFCTKAIIQEMFESFYEQKFDSSKFAKITDYKISPAVVNQYLFKNMTKPDNAIEELIILSNKKGPYNKTKKIINTTQSQSSV